MKIKYAVLSVAVFVIGTTILFAQPQTGSSDASAENIGHLNSVPVHGKASLQNANGVTITLTPVIMPAKPSAEWGIASDKLIAAARFQSSVILGQGNGPSDYTVPDNYVITWRNLVYAENGNMADGKQARVIWCLVDAKSTSDNLSLDMILTSFESNDGGHLNDVQTYGNASYASRSIGIRGDGSIIDVGSANQKCRRVILIVQSKLFNVGATQAGLDQTKSWVDQVVTAKHNYTLTYSVEIQGLGVYTTAVVSVIPMAEPPKLVFLRNGTLALANPDGLTRYVIYYGTDASAINLPLKEITGGESLTISLGQRALFFRAEVKSQ